MVVAIGNSALRQTWQQVLEQVGAPLGVVLHPRAIVNATAQLGLALLCPPAPLLITMPFAVPTANSVSTAAKPVTPSWNSHPVRLIPEKA